MSKFPGFLKPGMKSKEQISRLDKALNGVAGCKMENSLKGDGNKEFVWNIKKHPGKNQYVLTILGKMRPAMFLNVVGTLTWNDFSIIDARSFRQKQNTLDVFRIEPLSSNSKIMQRIAKAKNDFEKSLEGRIRLVERVRLRAAMNFRKYAGKTESEVLVRNGHLGYTRIGVSTQYDFPGILFLISDVLNDCRVYILGAQIQTNGGCVEDQFFVKNHFGQLLNSDERMYVRNELKKRLI